MRSGRAQSDDPPAPATIVQDIGKPSLADFDAHNPFWSCPGICIQSTRSWGSISADVVRRTAGKMVWRSDRHRIVYALTDVVGTIRNDNRPPQDRRLLRDHFSFRPSAMSCDVGLSAPRR